MPHRTFSLIRLKQLLAPVGQAHQGIATTIGLLASSGLNHTQLIPEMCHLLQKLFNLASCGFFWSDQDGNMQDAWSLSPEILSYKTLMSCQEYQASGNRTWPPFRENVLLGATVGYLLPFQNDRFYASPHYQATYQGINVRHILDVVLHDGARPFGAFLLMRSAQQGAFMPDECDLLTKLIPIINVAFGPPADGDTLYAEKATTGFALVDRNGRNKSMSEETRRIIWTITHAQPGSFADPNDPSIEDHFERLVANHWPRTQTGEKYSVDIENRWGRFQIQFEQEPRTRETIVTLVRKVPLASQLALCLAKHRWPSRRQMVAWLLAQNRSRKQIALAMGVSVESVTSHIKLIYKETRTASSHGLMLRLAS